MTRKDQKQFVRNLMNSIRDSILERSRKWPENWNGIELRQLVVDATEYSAEAHRYMSKQSKRFRDYENVRLTENLY